jgi:hypothetical protein
MNGYTVSTFIVRIESITIVAMRTMPEADLKRRKLLENPQSQRRALEIHQTLKSWGENSAPTQRGHCAPLRDCALHHLAAGKYFMDFRQVNFGLPRDKDECINGYMGLRF